MKIGVNTFGLGPYLHREGGGIWEKLKAGGAEAIEPCVAIHREPPAAEGIKAWLDKGIFDGVYSTETAEKLIPSLRRMGFEVYSFHLMASPFSAEAVLEARPFMERMGLRYCVCNLMEKSVVEIRKKKEAIETACGLLRECGMELLVHNHDLEWLPDEGTCVMQWLLEQIPGLRFEIDLGWTEYAGVSSAEILERYPDRFPLLHIKEIGKGAKARMNQPFCTAPGKGILPLRAILERAKAMPLDEEHALIIDQDDSMDGDIVADIASGIGEIRRLWQPG